MAQFAAFFQTCDARGTCSCGQSRYVRMMREPARLLTLDAMRGFAVMGILLMNVIAFSMPDMAYINPRLWGGETPAAFAVWTANFILVDGKMRGLFSLLFGASAVLIQQRLADRGEGLGLLYRRFFWLFLLGLCHYVFLWWGDILRLYAVAGFVLLLFVRREPGDLLGSAILFFLIQFAIVAAFSVSLLVGGEASLPGTDAATLREQAALHQSGYGAIVADRLARIGSDQTALLVLSGFEALGFMLLGAAMLKSGFLTGLWQKAEYLRIARLCYIAGGGPMIALAAWCWGSGFDPVVTFNAVISWSLPFRVPLTIAHAALLMWLILHFDGSRMIRWIGAAGRTAFSNYIGTSIVMTTLFYGYGLGLYGRVDRVTVYLFVPLVWSLMLLWPLPWLRHFRYGPFEWAWRSLTRWRWEPIRRC